MLKKVSKSELSEIGLAPCGDELVRIKSELHQPQASQFKRIANEESPNLDNMLLGDKSEAGISGSSESGDKLEVPNANYPINRNETAQFFDQRGVQSFLQGEEPKSDNSSTNMKKVFIGSGLEDSKFASKSPGADLNIIDVSDVDIQRSESVSQKTQNNISINDFEIIGKLGQGAYGKVYLAKYNNLEVALKKLSKNFLIRTDKVNSVFRERDILLKGSEC